MLPNTKSRTSESHSLSSTVMNKPKKKPPPRPPQPSTSRLQSSQSFRSQTQIQKAGGFNLHGRPSFNTDLIDFSTPPGSPLSSKKSLDAAQSREQEFMYRVGASIFYIKSPLKNSASHNKNPAPVANPFSPPRPSAQSLLATPTKASHTVVMNSANSSTSQTTGATTASLSNTTTTTKHVSKPTIIRPHGNETGTNSIQSQQQHGHGGSISSGTSNSSGSVPNVNINTASTQQGRYNNVPLTWDDPPVQRAAVAPTIIKPVSAATAVSTGYKAGAASAGTNEFPSQYQSRNYYDEPPELEDDEFDNDFNDTNIISPPMPNIPPPPPPADIDVEEWVDGTTTAAAYEEPFPADYCQAGETDRAYAIALYDYVPEAIGDLALQTGDLVYLTKKIDESWMYGACGGVEGMFPTSYVNVVVPLLEEEVISSTEVPSPEVPQEKPPLYHIHYAEAQYQFTAETESDLNLQAGETVSVMGRINDDWLYGEINGTRGQFPAAFVSPVPLDLPIITV